MALGLIPTPRYGAWTYAFESNYRKRSRAGASVQRPRPRLRVLIGRDGAVSAGRVCVWAPLPAGWDRWARLPEIC
jgi:hypothetical protein